MTLQSIIHISVDKGLTTVRLEKVSLLHVAEQ